MNAAIVRRIKLRNGFIILEIFVNAYSEKDFRLPPVFIRLY